MPIFNPPYFEIDKSETKRYAGLKKSEFKEEIINEACELARLIINPTGIWNMYDYDNKTQTIETEPKFSLQGSSIEKHLKECEKVILLAATLGIEVEEKITSLFEEGKYGLSIILDAAATAAIEQSADLMEKAIGDQVNRMGYKMKWRFSPGYGDWPIQQQPAQHQAAQQSVQSSAYEQPVQHQVAKQIAQPLAQEQQPAQQPVQHQAAQEQRAQPSAQLPASQPAEFPPAAQSSPQADPYEQPPWDEVPYDEMPYEPVPYEEFDAGYGQADMAPDITTNASPAAPNLTPDGTVAENPADVEAMLQAGFGGGVIFSETE